VGDNLEDWEDIDLTEPYDQPLSEWIKEFEHPDYPVGVLFVDSDEISGEEMDRMAEAEAQANLGISFQEFRKRWFRGDYKDDPRPEVTSTAFWIDQAWEMDCD